jgi:hypothetical protein
MRIIKGKYLNLRQLASRLALVVGCILLIFISLNARLAYYTSAFFYSMENLKPPKDLGSDAYATEPYLSDLIQVAHFLLIRSDEDRYRMIFFYNFWANMDTDPSGKYRDRVVNLYLLQRLLFDLPQDYPKDKAKSFVAIIWDGQNISDNENIVNMLWPLEYVDEHLTIKATLGGLYGLYDGAKEYDYFSTHFRLRSLDALEQLK